MSKLERDRLELILRATQTAPETRRLLAGMDEVREEWSATPVPSHRESVADLE